MAGSPRDLETAPEVVRSRDSDPERKGHRELKTTFFTIDDDLPYHHYCLALHCHSAHHHVLSENCPAVAATAYV